MKRFFALLLAILTVLPMAFSCGQSELAAEKTATAEAVTEAETAAETTEETETVAMTPQSPYEQSVTRILVIGNSASNDIFFQLGRVFNAQGFGGKKYMLSFLYYSGCKFSQHVDFLTKDAPVYDYYKTSSTGYEREEECTMKRALEDEQWDVILLHPGGAEDIMHEDFKLAFRRKIEAYVNEHVPTEHEFGFLHRGPNPNDPEIWGPNWPVTPPAGIRDRLQEYYSFDPAVQYAKTTEAVKKHILTDPTYVHNISTAAGMFYAQQVLGVAQTALFRDYTHLSDFGRVLAAYCFYVQFTGEAIDEVKLDMIPAKARQARYQSQGDLILTEDLKHIIKTCANYSLEHPWDSIVK
ncbi:MAG: DUF4886 domain-containing protein [Clostridia bacterium]|nr:DUF4886 domain-containing protein [Clostridia bacterium]